MAFTLRPATEADYPRILEILNAERKEPLPLEEFLRQERNRPKNDPRLQLVGCDADGTIVGYGESRTGSGQKPQHCFIWVTVDPGCRGRGAGGALYRRLEGWGEAVRAVAWESVVKDRDGQSWLWAERRGFEQHHHLFQSQLDLQAWDAAPLLPAVAASVSAGIRFTTLRDEITVAETFQRYYDFRFQLGRDIPDVAGRALPPYQQWRESIAANPAWDPARIFLAVQGERWVAMTQMTPLPAGGLYNAFTGVERADRGRGLALAVKVAALERARQQGVPYVRTSNHTINAPMVAVNARLGYVPYDGIWTLRKHLKPCAPLGTSQQNVPRYPCQAAGTLPAR